jgi:hypothetical protein
MHLLLLPRRSSELLLVVLCLCASTFSCIGLSSMFGVVAVVWFFAVDTWPLSLSLADALPSLLLGWILCCHRRFGLPAQLYVECVMAPTCGYFAALSMENALPTYFRLFLVGRILCRHSFDSTL